MTSPNEMRRATLVGLLVHGFVEIRKESDPRLKHLMGMVDLGELKMLEAHGEAAGIMHYRFVLTAKGQDRAHRVAQL